MNAVGLLGELEGMGINVVVEGDDLCIDAPVGVFTPDTGSPPGTALRTDQFTNSSMSQGRPARRLMMNGVCTWSSL